MSLLDYLQPLLRGRAGPDLVSEGYCLKLFLFPAFGFLASWLLGFLASWLLGFAAFWLLGFAAF